MVSLLPIEGLPLVEPGDALADLILNAAVQQDTVLRSGDVLVIAQKVVSKAEGRFVRLDQVEPSMDARRLSQESGKDARLVELILQESREIVRVRPGVIVVEDRRGFICANAGIDRSNVQHHGAGEEVALLPLDPDASAKRIRDRVRELTGSSVGVVINDSHGRAFREGTVGVAIGVSGIQPVVDHAGEPDLTGYLLQHTTVAVADELASAASLVMGPAAEGIPAVIARGFRLPEGEGTARSLQRPRKMDLFR